MIAIDDYAPIVGPERLDDLRFLARKLEGRTVQNINSTAVGGGVAEILLRMTPLLRQLGVQARWDVIKGDERFFRVTKAMHNALHGAEARLTDDDLAHFLEVTAANAAEMPLGADFTFVHDPQPIALIERRRDLGGNWAWRGHVDFSRPERRVWEFLSSYVNRYDAAVFSAPSFAQALRVPQVLIAPSIDPLSDKNRELSEDVIDEVCRRFGIDRTRPIVTQVSRFDYLKDPLGVIRAFKLAKRGGDMQLVLAGGGATDDPEGPAILAEVRAAAAGDRDIVVLFLPNASDIEVNAIQRASTIVLQKSLREGFGLTVAEALWKSKPVIASAVGGIPLQIAHQYSGILTHTIEGTAYWIRRLLHEPAYARRLGENGREHIRNNFLITRHIHDYLLLFLSLRYPGDVVEL